MTKTQMTVRGTAAAQKTQNRESVGPKGSDMESTLDTMVSGRRKPPRYEPRFSARWFSSPGPPPPGDDPPPTPVDASVACRESLLILAAAPPAGLDEKAGLAGGGGRSVTRRCSRARRACQCGEGGWGRGSRR